MASTTNHSEITIVAEDAEKSVLKKLEEDVAVVNPDNGDTNPSQNRGAPSLFSRLFKHKRKKCSGCNGNNKQKNKKKPSSNVGFEPIELLKSIVRYITPRQRFPPGVKKPIIYLFSPTEIDVDVTVSLSSKSQLSFSAIYPVVVPVKRGCDVDGSSAERIQWSVRTHLDGSLTEIHTCLEVSYLFWEAEINKNSIPSPPPSPMLGQPGPVECFNPVSCNICDTNSVVLPINNVPIYLDKTLRVLGLHTEARTSFITFWLPSLEKHKYIALRFIPQSAYERTAPMQISPAPDVVTRVFMVFCGVTEKSVVGMEWSNAVACAERDVGWWQGVVGMDLERALDPTLFRVLEWGGMEVEV